MEQIPDWQWHGVEGPELDALESLDELRTSRPILWGLVVQSRPITSSTLAGKLGMPHHIILLELKEARKHGRVHAFRTDQGLVWTPAEEELIELQRFVAGVRRQNRAVRRDIDPD